MKKALIDPKDYITQSEAARIIGMSRQAVAQAVKSGRLPSVIVACRKLVRRDVAQKYRRSNCGPKPTPDPSYTVGGAP